MKSFFIIGSQHEVSTALAKDSQLSVFDPEDLNITMAPIDNNFDARRAQVLNALTRDIDVMENQESRLLNSALEEYHNSLKQAVEARMHHTA